jgi:hypothetical protein
MGSSDSKEVQFLSPGDNRYFKGGVFTATEFYKADGRKDVYSQRQFDTGAKNSDAGAFSYKKWDEKTCLSEGTHLYGRAEKTFDPNPDSNFWNPGQKWNVKAGVWDSTNSEASEKSLYSVTYSWDQQANTCQRSTQVQKRLDNVLKDVTGAFDCQKGVTDFSYWVASFFDDGIAQGREVRNNACSSSTRLSLDELVKNGSITNSGGQQLYDTLNGRVKQIEGGKSNCSDPNLLFYDKWLCYAEDPMQFITKNLGPVILLGAGAYFYMSS